MYLTFFVEKPPFFGYFMKRKEKVYGQSFIKIKKIKPKKK